MAAKIRPAERLRNRDGPAGRTQLRVRDDGTFWGGGRWRDGREVEIADRVDGLDAHADLEIAVPAGRRVRVALAVGVIDARNVRGDLYLYTGSGEIRTASTTGELNLDTVRLETSSGRLRTDLPITLTRSSEDEIEGRIGEGGSARIEAETGSGDISIGRS